LQSPPLNEWSAVREKIAEEMGSRGANRSRHWDRLEHRIASVGKTWAPRCATGYTAPRDNVNLSSRLEGLNKDYGTHILVNETTYSGRQGRRYVFRELDLIRVKGKLQPVAIYELIGRAAENCVYWHPDEVGQRIALFHEAHELYRKRRWEDAQKILSKSFWTNGPTTVHPATYWKRCQEYLFDEPPSGWGRRLHHDHK